MDKNNARLSVVSPCQYEQYQRDGYVVIPHLIEPDLVAKAERSMWRLMGLASDQPAQWPDGTTVHKSFEDADLLACYGPRFMAAVADLGADEPASFALPQKALSINVFPQTKAWTAQKPHIDHAIKTAGYKVFPRAFRVATMTFLNSVAVHGGGTMVWPASHRLLAGVAQKEPQRLELMWALNDELPKLPIGEPLELTPWKGDVLFYQSLTVHTGSHNVSPRPRLALNCKW